MTESESETEHYRAKQSFYFSFFFLADFSSSFTRVLPHATARLKHFKCINYKNGVN